MDRLPRGVSNLMRQALLKFFDPAGPSFATGVVLNAGGSSVLFCCYFAGFIGDEKGLKDNAVVYAFGVYLKHAAYFLNVCVIRACACIDKMQSHLQF